MDRVGVFVDAGYVFAQGSSLLAGKKLPRGEVVLDGAKVTEFLAAFAQSVSGLPLLRIYWYDGTSTGPTAQHLSLAYLPGVKLRLGFVNSVGEQKGVDSLIVTDMITLAQNGAIAEAVLVSGDEDLRVGVQQAQLHGTRVHLVGIKPARGSQSNFLLQEADATYEWGNAEVETFLSVRQDSAAVARASDASTPTPDDAPQDALARVAAEIVERLDGAQLAPLVASATETGTVPKDVHAKLLTKGRRTLGRDLSPPEKREVRRLFLEECKKALAIAAASPEEPAV